jgi:hypothetical protein
VSSAVHRAGAQIRHANAKSLCLGVLRRGPGTARGLHFHPSEASGSSLTARPLAEHPAALGPQDREEVMKRFGTMFLASVMALVLANVAQANDSTPRVDRREVRQQDRIGQGVQSGQLTPHETIRLEKGEARIGRMEARDKADGKVTPAERMRLARAQNHESRRIYRLKHNARTQ